MRVRPISAHRALARLQRAQRFNQRAQSRFEERENRLQPQYEAGVDDVLAGRAAMDMGRMRLADFGAQQFDERGRDDAILRHALGEACDIG